MACSSTEPSDSGFATPAAAMVSLVLGLGAAVLVDASFAELKLARADLSRTQIEAALAGAEEMAAISLMDGGVQPVAMSRSVGGRNIRLQAEPEAPKASVTAVTLMDDRSLAPLGIVNPTALKNRLKSMTIAQALGPELEQADTAPQWRACARSLVSPFGLAQAFHPLSSGAAGSPYAPPAHTGEIWRVWARDETGWVDDRVVRLTANSLHPVATLARRFWKQDKESAQCQAVFDTP